MVRSLFYICILIFISFSATAQELKFTASTDAKRVLDNSYFTIEFKLENGNGQGFIPPDLSNFKIISGPSRMSSHSSINGVVSSSVSFNYTLSPIAIGSFTIGSAQIKSGSRVLKTQPISIEVIKSQNRRQSDQEDVFVKTVISDSLVYVGQQVILSYKLYTTLDVRSYNFLNENKFDGFFAEQLMNYRNSFTREIVNGVEYYTKSIKTIALFPQQTGNYTIDPVDITLGIANKNSSRGFFFSAQLTPRQVHAEGLNIIVQNTPPGNDKFSGAVGQYDMQINNTKRSLTTDDAISVIMQIVGNGDNKTVQAPIWDVPEGLTMYDPNILEDEVFPSNDEIKHRKTFEYLLVAEKPGTYNLRPSFNYFNPDSNRYVTISKNLPAINILPGNKSSTPISQSNEPEFQDIYKKTNLQLIGQLWHGSILHICLLAFLFLGLVFLVVYNIYLIKSGKKDPKSILKERAHKIAADRLKHAKELLDAGNSKMFYEEISYAIKKYLSDKHDINALHISKDELLTALKNSNIDSGSMVNIKSILEKCELAMYAPVSGLNMIELHEKSLALISMLETK